MFVYWIQSVVIGIFNVVRILQLKDFSTEGFSINDVPAQPTNATKIFTAGFFLFHYGFFHFVYLIFLVAGAFSGMYGNPLNQNEVIYILVAGLSFTLTHTFSYYYNRQKDGPQTNIGLLMFYPYVRILPMHLTIIFGGLLSGVLPIFLILKTLADCTMHIVEHQKFRDSSPVTTISNSQS
jgi:hypothetical protein